MQKRNKPIDSETLKKLEQEIYDNVMNYSNKNEVFLKLKELKNLSIHELRDVMPWKLIKKEIGIKQIFFSGITDDFVKITRKITGNRNVANNDSIEFSKINPQKAYNITYKYYLKSIFDNINNDIKDTLNKYEKNYTYIYPHEDAFEELGQEINTFSSEESKRWDKIDRISALFKIASLVPMIGVFKLINVNVDWWVKLIIGFGSYFSLNAIYNIYRYCIKLGSQRSKYKDKMASETKKIIDSELQPESATDFILDKFYDRVVKNINEKDPINHNSYKITALALTIILAIVVVYPSFINSKVSSPVPPSPIIPVVSEDEPSISKEDVEQYLKAKGVIPLISEEPLPEEEIRFVKEEITGKISSVTMNLSLDCASIILTDYEKGNFKAKATINYGINAKGWEITKGKIFVLDENKTLKENYKDKLYSEILKIYQGKASVINISGEIKESAKTLAKDKINELIKNRFPDIDNIDELYINYQLTKLDMSGTDLK